jgi:tetratricopeptide (TPR) repeat protein
MASKVNVKFVVTLAVGALVVFGGMAAAAYYLLQNSAADLIAKGDQALASAEKLAGTPGAKPEEVSEAFRKAADIYSRGVHKERTNVEYLRKWEGALTKYAPETRVTFDKVYMDYFNLLRQKATMMRTDVAAHRQFLDFLMESNNTPSGMEQVRSTTTEAITFFKDETAEKRGQAEVLRRYRGVAVTRLSQMGGEVKPADLDAAKQDLLAALKADPKDGEALEAMLVLLDGVRSQAARASKADEKAAAEAEQKAMLDAFLAANPADPRASVLQLSVVLREEQEKLPEAPSFADAMTQALQFQARMKPQLDAVAAKIQGANPAGLSTEIVQRLQLIELIVDPSGSKDRSEKILSRMIEVRPHEVQLHMLLSGARASRNDYAGAIEAASAIAKIPPQPVGVNGLRRFGAETQADSSMAAWAFKLWAGATAEEKPALLEKIKGYRERMARAMGADEKEMNLVNAQVAYAEGNIPAADRAIAAYNDQVRMQNADAVMLQADINARQGSPGLAREKLDMLLARNPGNVGIILPLANVEMQLQNYPRAAELLRQAKIIAKDNKEIDAAIRRVDALQGRGTVEDPVENELIRIANMLKDREEGVDAKAEEAFRALLKQHPENMRVLNALAIHLQRTGKKDDALVVAKEGLARMPNEAGLKGLVAALEAKDPLEGRLRMIDMSEGEELQKLMARHDTYFSFGKNDEARAELAKAVAIAPEDPDVVRRRFTMALLHNEMEEARRMADVAKARDIDGRQGETFRARVLGVEKKYEEAIGVLERALASGNPIADEWRLMGNLQFAAERFAPAADSFKKAVDAQPGDLPAHKDYLTTLVRLQRSDQALAHARQLVNQFSAVREEPEFLAMWLSLENDVGSKYVAVENRRRFLKTDGTDRVNQVSIANLLLDLAQTDESSLPVPVTREQRLAEARKEIDAASKVWSGLDIVTLEARYADLKGDPAGARRAFDEYIAKIPAADLKPEPLVAYARWLFSKGDGPGAVAQIERARAVQNPKVMEADKTLVSMYASFGQDAELIAAARRVVDGNADSPDHLYRKLCAEASIRLGNFDDADKDLKAMADAESKDPAVLLLRAAVHSGKGDARSARAAYDQAVQRFPNNAGVFAARGQYLMASPDTHRDSRADFDKALQLDPTNASILRARARLAEIQERLDDAIADMREALKHTPGDAGLRQAVIESMLRSPQQKGQARPVADQIAASARQDVSVLSQLGGIFARFGQFEDAESFLKDAYRKDPSTSNALALLNTYVNQRPPRTNDAAKVFEEIKDRVPKDAGLLMTRARLLSQQGRPIQEIKPLAADALKLLAVKGDGQQILAWYSQLAGLISNPKEMVPFLDQLASAGLTPKWMEFLKANNLFGDPATQTRGIEMLEKLARDEKNETMLRHTSFRTLTIGMYTTSKYEEAVAYGREAVKVFPDDGGFHNDLAFTLAVHLNKAEEALPFAEKGVEKIKNNAEVLDTLGVVQHKLGRLKEARDNLERSVRFATTNRTLVTGLVHLAEVCLELKDRAGAKKWVDLGRDVVTNDQANVPDDLKQKLRELADRV